MYLNFPATAKGPLTTLRAILAMVPILGLVLLTTAGCRPGAAVVQAAPVPPPPPEVDVATPLVQDSVEWDEYTGRLAAVENVEVRARVSGYLEKIHFQAGQLVQKGEVLFSIDPRPFQAELERARANVARAQAVLTLARYDRQRIEQLKREQAAPDKEYQDVVFAAEAAEADLARAESEEQLAALNLEWTKVVAPVSGRISRENVTVGNLVHDGNTGATLLTTIVFIDPIYVYFDLDEQAYLKYTRLAHRGEVGSYRENPNPVQVALFDESEFAHRGATDFLDNAIDPETGTIRGRAVLPNPDGLLIPGLFVRVRLVGSGVQPMVYVPDAAIAADQTRRLVYVVDSSGVVQARPVTLGRLQHSLRRIVAGLDGSEKVVVAGVQRVFPGTTVTPNHVEIEADAAAASLALARPALRNRTSLAGDDPDLGGTR